jgi:hypothetical protein
MVYKYRGFRDEYERNVLFKQELFFSNPNRFNDPFDFSIFPVIPDFSQQDILEKTAVEITEGHHSYNDLNEFISRKNDLIKKFSDTNKFKEDLHENIKNINNLYGVCCFSRNWDNITQWGYYGDSHKGYTIGFEYIDLWKLKYASYADDVKYVPKYPEIPLKDYWPSNKTTPEKHFFEISKILYFTKLQRWEHEDEWRMVKSFIGHDNNSRVLTYPIGILKEIVLGLNASKDDIAAVLEFASSNGISTYQTVKSDNEYSLDRKQLL